MRNLVGPAAAATFLYAIAATSTANAAVVPADCSGARQMFEGVCLDNAAVTYFKCLEKVNGGRIRLVKDEAEAKPTVFRLELEGAGKGLVASGSGKVMLDTRNEQSSIRKIDETISPDALGGCLKLAGLDRRPSSGEPRPPGKSPPGNRSARTDGAIHSTHPSASAANKCRADRCTQLGVLAEGDKDISTALKYYRQGCSTEDAQACLNAAVLLSAKYREHKEALALWTRGCDLGLAASCTGIGWIWEKGLGVAVDRRRAIQWYENACQRGDRTGCGNAAILLRDGGDGVPRDASRAVKYFTRACEQGEAYSCNNLGRMYLDGTASDSGVDSGRAQALFQRACNAGDGWGCLNLGLMREEGQGGTTPNPAEAANLYRRSCEGKNANGCLRLATLYENGVGVEHNGTEAQRLRELARQLAIDPP